jgi:diguanylate cyclase (GGDEF)-like protein
LQVKWTAETLVLFSVPSLALLALAVYGTSRTSRDLRVLRARLRCERSLLAASAEVTAASRRSSAAVFDALERAIADLHCGIDAVIVFLVREQELVCGYAAGARSEYFRHLRLLRDDVRTLPTRAAQLRCRAVAGPETAALLPADRFAVAVPLVDGAGVRAVVYAGSRIGPPEDLEALVRTIETAALPYFIAIERESDRSEALHDGLTGLLAPRPFRRQLHDEIARVAASGNPAMLALWFVDTDGFKDINDRFGHPKGDAVLQTLASLLRAHLVPGIGVAARNGGDEFCALLRGTTKAVAVARAQRFLEAVRRHDFGIPVAVTASIGVASYPYDASTSNALLEAADAAMYFSKREGRDRVSYATEPGTFASVAPEAESESSRSPERWASEFDASYLQRSP